MIDWKKMGIVAIILSIPVVWLLVVKNALVYHKEKIIVQPVVVNQYHTCYYNGVSEQVVPPCEEWVKVVNVYCQTFDNTNDMNCSDFKTWDDTQSIYKHSIMCTGRDIYRLDGDSDGIPCESLK